MDNFAGYDSGYDEFNLTGEYDNNAGSQSYDIQSYDTGLIPYNGIDFQTEVYGMDFEQLRCILEYKKNIIM